MTYYTYCMHSILLSRYYAKTLSRTFSTARNTSRGPDEDYRQEIFTNFILLTMPCIAKLESQ